MPAQDFRPFWIGLSEEQMIKVFGKADPWAYVAEMTRQGNNLECTDRALLRRMAKLVHPPASAA